MYKSQGRTFKEVHMEFNEDEYTTRDLGFVPDPFFEKHLKDTQALQKKQRESALGFNMDKVLDLRDELGRPDVHLAGFDPALIYFDEVTQDGDKMWVEFLKRRDSTDTNRLKYEVSPDMHFLPKAVVHDEVQFERKHPYMFKITDLTEDPAEFLRLENRLESDRQFEKYYGFKMAPIFIEAIPDANVLARTVNDTMKKLVKLSVEYKVEIYFGTKSALKPLLYQFMYGARRADMDLSKVEEISVEKAQGMVDKQTKVAIIGGSGSMKGLIQQIIADQYDMQVRLESSDFWDFRDFSSIAKRDNPTRDWENQKLRRGKGHNKFKRKGKK